MDGMLLKYIFQHITYMSITGDNPENHYIQARDICPEYTGDLRSGGFMLRLVK